MNLKPLEGLRVLDLTHAHAGPICTLYLAGMGAEVIKIEPPWGEMTRMFPPLVKGVSPYFAFLDRCKKGVTLDLKKPRGKTLFAELVERSDVIVENFSPGTMEDLGFGWESLRELNPGMIYASISGFGQTGPWRNRRSFDPVAQAASGFMWLERDSAGEGSGFHVAPEAIADTIPGFTALIGILAALHHRGKTGEGQRIDVAQMDAMIAVQQSISFWNLAGTTFNQAIRDAGPAVYGLYEAKDGHVMCSVTAGRLTDWLRELLEVDELTDEAISSWVSERTVGEVVRVLSDRGIPVSPVYDLDEVQSNAQALARDMLVRVEDPSLGEHIQPGFPVKFSDLEGDLSAHAPKLGEHNHQVYSDTLGISEEELEELRREGVI